MYNFYRIANFYTIEIGTFKFTKNQESLFVLPVQVPGVNSFAWKSQKSMSIDSHKNFYYSKKIPFQV